MFLNNAIYNYLNNKVDAAILKKGSELMRNRFVSQVVHYPSDHCITAIVKDVNKVTVRYENAFTLRNVSCSCHASHICEHTVAALYQILSLKDAEITVSKLVTTTLPNKSAEREQQKIVSGKNTISKVVQIAPSFLENGAPNNYKQLQANSITELERILPKIKPPYPGFFGYQTQFIQYLNNVGELEFILVDRYAMSFKQLLPFQMMDSPEFIRVVFKSENGALHLKCSSCSRVQNKLCDHQFFALQQNGFLKLLFSDLWRDRAKLVQDFSIQYKTTPQRFEKIFKIGFNHEVPIAVRAIQNYMSQSDLQEEKNTLKILEQSTEVHYHSFIEKLSSKSKSQKANAFLWVFDDDEGHTPTLLEGSASKSGDKLSSNITRVNRSAFLSPDEEELFEQFTLLKEQFKKNYDYWYYRILLKMLSENKSILQGIIHYSASDDNKFHKISKSDLSPFTFGQEEASLIIDTEEDEDFLTCKIYVKIGDQQITPDDPDLEFYPIFAIYKGVASIYKDFKVFQFLSDTNSNTIITDKENPEPLIELLHEYNKFFEVNYPQNFKPETIRVENPTRALYLREGGNFVIMEPRLELGDDISVQIPSDGKIMQESDENMLPVFYECDPESELSFIEFLNQQHPELEESYKNYGLHYIDVKELVRHAWFLKFFESCKEAGIAIYGQENLKNFRFNTNSAKININVSSGIDWFDVNVDIAFGDQKVRLKNWVDSVRNNEKYVVLDDGSLGLIPDEWFEKLKQVALVSDEEKGKLSISKFRIGVVESLFEEIADEKLFTEVRQKMRQLAHYEFKKDYKIPDTIKAELREYQVMGFQWLKALSDLGFGGCLADDMGLGKTVQVISLLADQKQLKKNTSIAIVPRSLLFNWAAEIDKFCPALTYIHYHGPDRMLKRNELLNYDLIITTYDTATNDVEYFTDITFNYIILDESQAIKNPASKRYKAMRLLKAKNRIVMTGTPIENNTFDLFAQFSFINPGIFGSSQYFRTHFSNAIDKNNDADTAGLLRKLINPFLLRRTKEQVASDLPERTENIIYCDMDSIQRSYYDALKNTIRAEIEQSISKTGFDKARFKIIEGLLRLRQVCNAPQLVDQSLPPHKRVSVKIETLMDIIENDLGNHNALIFSQFTSMLDIVRSALDKKHIKYAYLDGSTKDRKAAVEYFDHNEEIKLFLISLKAGNTGLNLTKADYVYLIDPWWNPAVEAQAIDRTHRIGQTKNVFAYKMICKNTIEEKIIELQNKKKKLASDLVMTDESVFKSLDREELLNLFN